MICQEIRIALLSLSIERVDLFTSKINNEVFFDEEPFLRAYIDTIYNFKNGNRFERLQKTFANNPSALKNWETILDCFLTTLNANVSINDGPYKEGTKTLNKLIQFRAIQLDNQKFAALSSFKLII